METHGGNPTLYKDILLLLGTAGVVIPLFHRLRISPVIGYLLAGVVIGPYGIGRLFHDSAWPAAFSISDTNSITFLGELGVVMLLFMIGLELSPARLYTMRRPILLLGTGQFVLSAGVLGFGAFMLGMQPAEAAVLGLALAMSSTAIVVELLSQQKRLGTKVGRATFSILLLQDLAFVAILLFVGFLGRSSTDSVLTGIVVAVLQAAVAIGIIMLLGHFLLRPFLALVAEAGGSDLFLASTMFIVVGAAVLSNAAGFSLGFGAFVAGLLMAETEFRREAESLIDPFKGLLLGIFFISVTMTINPLEFLEAPILVLTAVVAVIAAKAAVVLLVGQLAGLGRRVTLETALLTGPGGEFGFVTVGAAAAVGALAKPLASQATLIIAISMFALPFVSHMARRITQRIAPAPLEPEVLIELPENDGERVVIIGYGRVGQLVAAMMEEHDIPYIAVDSDARLVGRHRGDGKRVYYGNAERPEFLRRCGLDRASALVVTMDGRSKVDAVTQIARAERADLIIVARARDDAHARHLYGMGVTDAVPETTEASLQLGEAVLDELGVPMGIIIAAIHERREVSRRQLGRKDRRRQAMVKPQPVQDVADHPPASER